MSLDRIASPLVSSRAIAAARGFVGFLFVVATLALTSPGVQIARAADEVASTPAAANMSVDPTLADRARRSVQAKDGPSCAAASSPLAGAHGVEQQLQRLQRDVLERVRAQASAPQPASDGIVLNGRGYNYRQPSAQTR